MSTLSTATYWCHECEGNITPKIEDHEMKCPVCSSPFIEEIEDSINDHPSSFVHHTEESMMDTTQTPHINTFPVGSSSVHTPHFTDTPAHPMPLDISSIMNQLGAMFGGSNQGDTPGVSVQVHMGPRIQGSGGTMPLNVQQLLSQMFGMSGTGDFGSGRSMEDIINQLFVNRADRGPPPASKEVVDALPIVCADELDVSNGLDCTVCQDAFELNEETLKLPCEHRYHSECIKKWLEQRNTCPVCRHSLEPTEDTTTSTIDSSTGGAGGDTGSETLNSADTPSSFYI